MTNQPYDPRIESSNIYLLFLEANGLKRCGVDFKNRTGIYEFTETDNGNSDKFTGLELTTAYAGFSDGYYGNANKCCGPFGSLKLKREEEKDSKTETLLRNEKSILSLVGKEEKLREHGFSIETCTGALNVTRNKIYSQQYQLGRQTNSLNE